MRPPPPTPAAPMPSDLVGRTADPRLVLIPYMCRSFFDKFCHNIQLCRLAASAACGEQTRQLPLGAPCLAVSVRRVGQRRLRAGKSSAKCVNCLT